MGKVMPRILKNIVRQRRENKKKEYNFKAGTIKLFVLLHPTILEETVAASRGMSHYFIISIKVSASKEKQKEMIKRAGFGILICDEKEKVSRNSKFNNPPEN